MGDFVSNGSSTQVLGETIPQSDQLVQMRETRGIATRERPKSTTAQHQYARNYSTHNLRYIKNRPTTA